jgi:hypothetical protein
MYGPFLRVFTVLCVHIYTCVNVEVLFSLIWTVNLTVVFRSLLSLRTDWNVLWVCSLIHFYSPGQLFCFNTLLISFSLSLCSLVQSYIRWSTVWFPPSQGHYGDCIILKRCRYALVLPWAVTIAVKFGVNLILVVSLSFMVGKNCYVVDCFVVRSHWQNQWRTERGFGVSNPPPPRNSEAGPNSEIRGK